MNKKKALNVIIKNHNIKLNFNNCEIFSIYKPFILIEQNIYNITLYLNNCVISNSFNFPLLKINHNSDVFIFINNSIISGGIIFFNENNNNNIFFDGHFKINKKNYHKKGKINLIKNYTIYYENYKINN